MPPAIFAAPARCEVQQPHQQPTEKYPNQGSAYPGPDHALSDLALRVAIHIPGQVEKWHQGDFWSHSDQ